MNCVWLVLVLGEDVKVPNEQRHYATENPPLTGTDDVAPRIETARQARLQKRPCRRVTKDNTHSRRLTPTLRRRGGRHC